VLRNLFRQVADLLTGAGEVTDQLFDELEEVLIVSDVSTRIASETVALLRQAARERGVRAVAEVHDLLRAHIVALLEEHAAPLVTTPPSPPLFYLVVGVNGTGKTTTIAKLGHRFQKQGKLVLLAAADTFRAAAIDQLAVWADRVGADLIKHQPGGDPGAVVFDSIQAARARGADVVIADTAGRLHTQRNLMEELRKVDRVARRGLGRAPDETLLILDATTGQNTVVQAKVFKEAVGITGLVMTKLDGTAKGGTLITVSEELGLPVKLIGVGERMEDLKDFDAEEYARELLP
jgi:fused signal recognition particle receptor